MEIYEEVILTFFVREGYCLRREWVCDMFCQYSVWKRVDSKMWKRVDSKMTPGTPSLGD